MPDTAKRMARVPILGEDGRISDDYVPAAIGEGVESAEAAATRAETAATNAEGSASAASQSATGAQGSASAASTSAAKAQESATAAGGAVTQAQSAQKAAEAAKTGAESARDSAKTAASKAQQSATAAAESAGQVADKFIASAQATTLEPGSQATASVADQVLTLGIPRGDKGDKGDQGDKGDPGDVSAVQTAEGSDLSVSTDGGTVTIDDSALRARISELENQAANVVTGISTGLVAHGEDAYAQKPREVRVKGKTWVNRWPVLSGTHNGITVTTDETGLITVTGTATANVNVVSSVVNIKRNSAYYILTTLPATSVVNSTFWCIIARHDTQATVKSIGSTDSGSFQSGDYDQIDCSIYVNAGQTVNASFRVMLVDGTEAPDCFTPPASITSVQPQNLVTSGKNLLARMGPKLPYTYEGITFSDNGDGGIRVSGTATAAAYYNLFNKSAQKAPFIPSGTYTASLTGMVAGVNLSVGYFDYEVGGSFSNWLSIAINAVTGSVDRPVYLRSFLSVASGTTVDIVVYPQLELGSTATAYEPPIVTTTPLPEVELRSLPNGTCDELVIKSDGTCEVERRTGYIASYTDEEVTGEYVSTGNGLEAGASIVYELDEPTAEPQSPVTLPALPAPTFNQYHDSSVPSDTSTEYVRDINIVLDNLAKQVAGTASAVAVREASTIEEE